TMTRAVITYGPSTERFETLWAVVSNCSGEGVSCWAAPAVNISSKAGKKKRWLLVIVQQRKNIRVRKLLAAVEKVQLHHEAHPYDLGAQRSGQLRTGVGGPTGSQ